MAFITDNMVVEGGMTASTFSATTYTNLPPTVFIGGTVTGATIFTGGLTANTISATTITGGTIVKSGGTSSQFLMADGSVIATGQTPGAMIASMVCTLNTNLALTNTAVTITFDTDEFTYGTIARGASAFTATSAGLYTFSVQPQVVVNNNTVNTTIWFQKNNVNIPRSAYRTSAFDVNDNQVLPINVTFDLAANDQIVIKGTTSIVNGSTLTAVASGATVPAIPSVMVDIKGWKK